jgi:DNA mismatch endonuclease (patch repair protein)
VRGSVPAPVSQRMAKVRRRDTAPEQQLMRFLISDGVTFERHATHLSGSPDIVFRRHKVAVFVHGCFWHGHAGYRRAQLPAANSRARKRKIETNLRRDRRVVRALRAMGWSVLIVWACNMRAAGLSRVRSSLLSRLGRARGNRKVANGGAPSTHRRRCSGVSRIRYDGGCDARTKRRGARDLDKGACIAHPRSTTTNK